MFQNLGIKQHQKKKRDKNGKPRLYVFLLKSLIENN